MAQSIIWQQDKVNRRLKCASNVGVSVAASGNTTLLQIPVSGLERIFVQFDVTTNNLDAFLIRARASLDATTTTLYSVAADYTSPAGLMVGASGDLTTVAAAASGWFIMDVRGLYDVTIQASASGGAATVTIYAGGQ
jgi:hypothetical protein